jgi:hypothetical protein
MTIAAAYLTPEGVVLGADSTTTTMTKGGVGQLLNNAQKVFEVGPCGQGRMAFCTWGSAMIGELSHRTIGALLAERVDKDATIQQASDTLVDIVKNAPGPKDSLDVGYFLGGINPSHAPECNEITLVGVQPPGEQPQILSKIQKVAMGDAGFRGVPDFFTRCFHGFDPKLPGALSFNLLKELGTAAPPNFQAIFDKALLEARKDIYTGWTSNLPLRDAIAFVHMFIHLTIMSFKFRLGPPICGGEAEVGFVSTDRPFRWVCHKNFDSAI